MAPFAVGGRAVYAQWCQLSDPEPRPSSTCRRCSIGRVWHFKNLRKLRCRPKVRSRWLTRSRKRRATWSSSRTHPSDCSSIQQLLAQACRAAAPETLICSSTSNIQPSLLQAQIPRPERLLVAHPFLDFRACTASAH
ncbi:3-hydroxyacyl-CoA dehydrogenase NAD-binding domain-containing protein [Bradyrhizobium tunisiense]|uniref:3-hydroxyacyl-CoA dehydrogenase NAD-binding domain-containing protein n=1 Tax=Bradyrhizobium tunisiense TaxID=3278709 RepID=UPI0035D86D86